MILRSKSQTSYINTPSTSWLPFSGSKVHVPSGYLEISMEAMAPRGHGLLQWKPGDFLPGDSRIRPWDATVHHEDLVVQHMAQRRGTEDLREEVRHLLLVLHLTAGTSTKKNGRYLMDFSSDWIWNFMDQWIGSKYFLFFRKLETRGFATNT